MKVTELRLGCLLFESQFLRTKFWVKRKTALLRKLVLFWEEDGLMAQKTSSSNQLPFADQGKSF